MFSFNKSILDESDTNFNSLNNEKNETIENISMPFNDLNETNFSTLSEISGINVSERSEINNTLDFTENLLKELTISKPIRTTKCINKNLEEKVRDYKMLLYNINCARIKSCRTKLILQAMDDIFDDNSSKLPKYLKEKCLLKLRCCNLMKTFNYNPETLKVINITNSEEIFQLNAEEISMIQPVLKETLSKNCLNLKTESDFILDILGKQASNVTLPGSILTEDKAIILNLISELAEIIDSCVKEINLVILSTNEMREIRVSKFQELYKREMDCLENKTKLLALNMRNLNYMIENAVIQSNENVGEAVDALYKELRDALEQIEYSMQKLKTKKEEYDSLKGTKFDDILHEYVELRENWKHKSWALKQLQNSQ